MPGRSRFLVFLFPTAVLSATIGCAPPIQATPYPAREPATGQPVATKKNPGGSAAEEDRAIDTVVRYFERQIDLRPLLTGFPWSDFQANLDSGDLFFLKTGRRYDLQWLKVGAESGGYELPRARRLTDEDWSKRSLWTVYRAPAADRVWLHADDGNDERMNLWTTSLEGGELRRVTDFDYVYAFGFDVSGQRVAYLPRHGNKAPYRTCLHVLDVARGDDQKIVCDDDELQFTWGKMVFSPDGSEVYFSGQRRGSRRAKQLVRVDVTAKSPQPVSLTALDVPRTTLAIIRGWIDGSRLVFRADDDGFDNLHVFHRDTGKVTQLTSFAEDVGSAEHTGGGIVAIHGTPAGSTMVLVDPRSGSVLDRRPLRGTAQVLDGHGDQALVRHEAPDLVLELLSVHTGGQKLHPSEVVEVPSEVAQSMVRCRSSAVTIPTFDIDPATGKQRLLHAFLLEPVDPAPPTQRLASIRAFYGGRNAYDVYDHVLCAAGLTVLSPAVRGSDGFGQAFSSLNDRDLGGGEIVDLFYAARWLERKTGLDSRRIGVHGRSHGGYATLRALTFPERATPGGARYPFGFGLAEAAFTSIESFHAATNIPDWVVRESGDPSVTEDLQRMRDRSPLTHVSRLTAPVLLIHGGADWRVPPDESRRFVAAARELDKPVQYVEVEGQGHHVEGLELQVRAYRARLDFLRAVAEAVPETTRREPRPSAMKEDQR